MAAAEHDPEPIRSARRNSVVVGVLALTAAVVDVAVHWYRGDNLIAVYTGTRGLWLLALLIAVVMAVQNLRLRVTPEARLAALEHQSRVLLCPRCGRRAARNELTCKDCGAVVDKPALVGALVAVAVIALNVVGAILWIVFFR